MSELHVLRAGDLEAAWAPGVGMVGTSLRHRGEELLGQRGGLEAYRERGSSFGIPFLHPWANRVSRLPGEDVPEIRREEHGLAIHGLLTASPDWEVLDATPTVLRAALDLPPRLLPAFPFGHRVELAAALAAEGLTVTTALRATGEASVPVSFGFHPYLTLPGVPREEWEVSLPVRRRALLEERGLPTGRTEEVEPWRGLLAERTFDDAYVALEAGRPWTLAGGGRRLEIWWDVQDFPVAQVFSPPGAPFVCFEPMTAPVDALTTGDGLRRVEPGEEFSAAWELRVA